MSVTGVATTINDFMNAAPSFIWVLVCGAVVAVPLTLLHELGHALVARARLGSDVRVTVGNTARIGTIRLGRVTTTLNLFQGPTRIGGMARVDTRHASAQDMLWISLAGPAASLAGGVVVDLAYRHAPASGVTHALLWAAVPASVFAVANLIPFQVRERRDGPAFRSDGLIALAALTVLCTSRSHAGEARAKWGSPSTSNHAASPAPATRDIGVRVWPHGAHLYIGVGAREALEAGAGAAVGLPPSAARDLGRAIIRFAEDLEQAAAIKKPDAKPPATDASVAPPGPRNENLQQGRPLA